MSAYEQRIEPPDKAWQYLLFAAEPYETIAFKVCITGKKVTLFISYHHALCWVSPKQGQDPWLKHNVAFERNQEDLLPSNLMHGVPQGHYAGWHPKQNSFNQSSLTFLFDEPVLTWSLHHQSLQIWYCLLLKTHFLWVTTALFLHTYSCTGCSQPVLDRAKNLHLCSNFLIIREILKSWKRYYIIIVWMNRPCLLLT